MGIKFFDLDFSKALEHKYKSINKSIVYKYITLPIMKRILEFIPRNLAPNLITLTGFSFMIINLISIYILCPLSLNYSEISKNSKPTHNPLINIISAFCLFVYWILDNLDGHQARRTNSGSPLGMFADHGIDSFNNSIICIAFYTSANLSNSLIFILLLILFNMGFLLTTLDNKLTGIFYLWYFSLPDDGLLSLIIIHLLLINKNIRRLFKKIFNKSLLYFLFIIISFLLLMPVIKNFKTHAAFELLYFLYISILAFLVFEKNNEFYIYSCACSSFLMNMLISHICEGYKLFPLGFLSSFILLFLKFKKVNKNILTIYQFMAMFEMFLVFGISVNRFEKVLNISFFFISS